MGLPGTATIRISTEFDNIRSQVTRTVQFVDGYGLNSLTAGMLGDKDSWHITSDLVGDTLDLPDGEHEVAKKQIGGHYVWRPVKE